MDQKSEQKSPRERSPSFPMFSLKVALARLKEFEKKFGRHPAPFEKAGLAWGMEQGSSQANRYLAALKAFGLISYAGSGKERSVSISDGGRKYLLAEQQVVKDEVVRGAALKPKAIAKFWPTWGSDRPPNELCLDDLVFKHGFTKSSAPQFLRVYDETIAFAGLSGSDKVDPLSVIEDDEDDGREDAEEGMPAANPGEDTIKKVAPLPANTGHAGGKLEAGERILTTGILAKDASFKLIVSGRVGPKELDRLIRKLELDKEILADPENGEPDAE